MANYYSSDKNTQILVSLLKAHGIRRVIASPGTTNIAFVGSLQYDPFFEIYSSADERSAAYMACGMASATGEPVIITCTEATASRNYLPALTEAYYRKLPILVVTGHHGEDKIGHLSSQTIDRRCFPNDALKLSVSINKIHSSTDEWQNIVNINKAILELDHHGKGPVHINLEAGVSAGFNDKTLPKIRVIRRLLAGNDLPSLPSGRIAIFIGSHAQFSDKVTDLIDGFCSSNDSVVFCDNTSGYSGCYKVNSALIASQQNYVSDIFSVDLLIHIGEVSGDTYTTNRLKPKCVWRVSSDGELRDTFKKLTYVFEMDETKFFSLYNSKSSSTPQYLNTCKEEYDAIYNSIPDLDFSNIWMAKELCMKIPKGSTIHFSIFNSLRSWNFFQIAEGVISCCNVGGFGIDGAISTLIGSSLAYPQKLHFLIVGDLAFFYDMNALGNRHVGSNIRILLVNNGRGVEFRKLDHPGSKFGEDADKYFAAAGHYGNKSDMLVKHYAEDLGFEYMSARDKTQFYENLDKFVTEKSDRSILFEVFTETENEINVLNLLRNIRIDKIIAVKHELKQVVKGVKRVIGK